MNYLATQHQDWESSCGVNKRLFCTVKHFAGLWYRRSFAPDIIYYSYDRFEHTTRVTHSLQFTSIPLCDDAFSGNSYTLTLSGFFNPGWAFSNVWNDPTNPRFSDSYEFNQSLQVQWRKIGQRDRRRDGQTETLSRHPHCGPSVTSPVYDPGLHIRLLGSSKWKEWRTAAV